MNQTEYYQLSLWDAEDRIQRTDFNADNAKIEAALAGLDAAIAAGGNCRIYTTTYVGNGKYGSANPNTLTFPHKPVWMMVFGGSSHIEAFPESGYAFNIMNTTESKYGLICSRSGNTLSWYASSGSATTQMNDNRTYYVMALLDASE